MTRSVKAFLDLPRVHPVPTLCTHIPLVLFFMSVVASDLRDGKIKVRGTMGQVGPDTLWFYGMLGVIAAIVLCATYRSVTAVEALLRDRG